MTIKTYDARLNKRPTQRLLTLKHSRFSPAGRRERVRAALRGLEEAVTNYGLDANTMRWLAEESDLEES